MDTLPRFKLPDESASFDASTARLRAVEPMTPRTPLASWSEFDDLDSLVTRVREKEEPFDAAPTQVRPSLGRLVMVRGRKEPNTRRELDLRRAKNDAPIEDVVEELRAAAAGRKARVRELPSSELLPDGSGGWDEAQEVDVGELMFDRPVPAREVWNVHQAAPRPPQVTALIPPRSGSRFVITAAFATLAGALLAIAAAFLAWRLAGMHF